jgi:Xaa-Pro dipeptidase
MRRHHLDAVLLTGPANIRYFSGFETQFWESPTRPWYVIIPLARDPIAVIPEIGAPAMTQTWLQDIRTWPAPRPADDGMSLLAEALSSLPRRFGRIGAELGREMSLRMPVVDFLTLRDRLAHADLVNGSPCIWDVRMIKSEAEVVRIEHICRIVSEAYASLPHHARIGDTEREVCRRLRMNLLDRGADATPFMPGISGAGGVSQIIAGPGDRALEDGDVLFIDTGSTYDGYFCDFDRTYAVGTAADAMKRAHEIVWQATEAGIAAAVPGQTTEDVWRAMARVLEAAGAVANNVGRLGHGLGLQLTEPPSTMRGDATVLQPGMVLTIEPGMEYASGKMIVHEEDIVVTSDGARLLSARAPREPWIVR